MAVNIDGFPIRPLPQELFNKVGCTNCQIRSARWELAEGSKETNNFACSMCFLYGIDKLKEQREALDSMVAEVEKAVGYEFPRDEYGRVCVEHDTDRLAFGIVMSQRFFASRTVRGSFS